MIPVDGPRIASFAHFVEDLKNSLAALHGVSNRPAAISILNDSVRWSLPEGVFDEHTVCS
jgi:hypothetical protein